jgi:hypothetical protein
VGRVNRAWFTRGSRSSCAVEARRDGGRGRMAIVAARRASTADRYVQCSLGVPTVQTNGRPRTRQRRLRGLLVSVVDGYWTAIRTSSMYQPAPLVVQPE